MNFSKIDKKALLLAVVVGLGILIRFWNFPSWLGFDYDQEINARIARDIISNHKLTLLGPETSVGGLYVGPFYNYLLAAAFALFAMDPAAVIPLGILISVLTLVCTYFFTREVFQSASAGFFAVIIYAFSETMIIFDRIAWNPTAMPLVTLGMGWFLFRYLKEHRTLDLIVSSVFLGWSTQLHFTWVILAVFFSMALLIFGWKKILFSPGKLVWIGLILLIFLSPLILFDFRHHFLISQHLVSFFSGPASAAALPPGAAVIRAWQIYVGFSRAIVIREQVSVIEWLVAGTALVFSGLIVKHLRDKSYFPQRFLGLFLLVYFLAIAIYRGPVPSQYLLPVFAWLIVLAGGAFYWLVAHGNWYKILVTILFGFFLLINLPRALAAQDGTSLANKKAAVAFVSDDAGRSSFRVEFINLPGRKTGFEYLFWLRGRRLVEEHNYPADRVYKIVIPSYLVGSRELSATFGSIGVIR